MRGSRLGPGSPPPLSLEISILLNLDNSITKNRSCTTPGKQNYLSNPPPLSGEISGSAHERVQYINFCQEKI